MKKTAVPTPPACSSFLSSSSTPSVYAATSGGLGNATREDLSHVQDLIADSDVAWLCEHMGTEVVWRMETFIDKVGFSHPKSAIRNAKSRGLIMCEMPIRQAIGLTEVDGRKIINPLSAETPITPHTRTVVRFMCTMDVLEWLSGAGTEKAKGVRRALWWVYFIHPKEHVQIELEAAENKVCTESLLSL